MPRTVVLLAFAAVLVSLGIVAQAHPGGLDGNGCHYENDTGRYHCHRTVKANANVKAPAKKSRENVCHGATSPNYTTLKYFIAFETMEACLKSGGRAFGS
jgi:hypothetical protein